MAYAIYSLYNIYRALNKGRQGIPPLHPPPAGYFHATTQTFSQPRRFANVLADYVSVCAYANSCLAYSPTTENTRDRVQTNVWPIRPPLCRPDRFEQKIFSELNAGIIDKSLPDERSRLHRPGQTLLTQTGPAPRYDRFRIRSTSTPTSLSSLAKKYLSEKWCGMTNQKRNNCETASNAQQAARRKNFYLISLPTEFFWIRIGKQSGRIAKLIVSKYFNKLYYIYTCIYI